VSGYHLVGGYHWGEGIIWRGRISSKMDVDHLERIDIIWSRKSIIWGYHLEREYTI
jgi:hypothetical protein